VERGLDVGDGHGFGGHTLERLDQVEAPAQNLRGAGVRGLHTRSRAHSCKNEVTARVQLAFDTHKESSNLAKRSTACARAFPSSSLNIGGWAPPLGSPRGGTR